jgi:hypothetical protein
VSQQPSPGSSGVAEFACLAAALASVVVAVIAGAASDLDGWARLVIVVYGLGLGCGLYGVAVLLGGGIRR